MLTAEQKFYCQIRFQIILKIEWEHWSWWKTFVRKKRDNFTIFSFIYIKLTWKISADLQLTQFHISMGEVWSHYIAQSTFARLFRYGELLFYACILLTCIKIGKVSNRKKWDKLKILVYRSLIFTFYSANTRDQCNWLWFFDLVSGSDLFVWFWGIIYQI